MTDLHWRRQWSENRLSPHRQLCLCALYVSSYGRHEEPDEDGVEQRILRKERVASKSFLLLGFFNVKNAQCCELSTTRGEAVVESEHGR